MVVITGSASQISLRILVHYGFSGVGRNFFEGLPWYKNTSRKQFVKSHPFNCSARAMVLDLAVRTHFYHF